MKSSISNEIQYLKFYNLENILDCLPLLDNCIIETEINALHRAKLLDWILEVFQFSQIEEIYPLIFKTI